MLPSLTRHPAVATSNNRARTIRRAAFFIGSLSVAFAILGMARAAAVLYQNRASAADMRRLFDWAVMPLAVTGAGTIAMLGGSIAPVWLCVGALWGFVVLGAWSLGPFYAVAALVLLFAALVHLAAQPSWKVLVVPLWLLTGASSLAVVMLMLDWSYQGRGYEITEAPVVVFGSWIFVESVATLGAVRLLRRRPRSPLSNAPSEDRL